MRKHFDTTSLVVITATLVLFVLALFTKGLSHDLFLESAVFLISVKLILMAYKNSTSNEAILKELQEIKTSLNKK